MSDATVCARIPVDTKERAVAALDRMGFSASDLIRMVFHRVAEEGRIPFSVEVPNATTRAAVEELVSGGGQRFESAEAMFKDLGL